MYNYSQDGVTIASMLDTRKANKDDKFPVKIRVTYRRDRKYYPTGKDLTIAEWEKLPDTKSKVATELKNSIRLSFEIVSKIVHNLINEGTFSFNLLNIRLGKGLTGSVNAGFKAKIDALESDGSIGTYYWYSNSLSSMEKFAGKNVLFKEITVEWLKKYEKWMLEKDLSYSSISMYIRALRAIINEAMEAGVMKRNDYPFSKANVKGKYQIPSSEGRKLALNLEQVKKLINYTDGKEATERYRDLWFLSYLINGINIGDLLKLKDRNFVNGEILYYRFKTLKRAVKKKEIAASVTPKILELIERWGVPGRKPNDYIFPYLTGISTPMEEKVRIADVTKRVNKRLAAIGKTLGITGLTTYSARHSFATVLKLSGAGVPYISEALGHPDVKTTEDYLGKFESEQRRKNAELLTNF